MGLVRLTAVVFCLLAAPRVRGMILVLKKFHDGIYNRFLMMLLTNKDTLVSQIKQAVRLGGRQYMPPPRDLDF